MVFFQPEKSVCDQEVTHFAPTKVEDQRAPIAVFSLPRIGVFVKSCSVELSQSKGVLREMARNPVQNDSDTFLVAAIDEMTKLVRIPKTARWRIITGDLVTPETRALMCDGSTDSRYASSWSSNSFHEGMLITRASTPCFLSASCAPRHNETSLPVPISNTSGFPLVASESTYAPRRSPDAGASFERSKVGSAWRLKINTTGSCFISMIRRHASATSFASHGRISAKPGIARSEASCSTG